MSKSCSYEVRISRGKVRPYPRERKRIFLSSATAAKKAAQRESKKDKGNVISVTAHCATGTKYHWINCLDGICSGRYTKSRRVEAKRRKRAKQNRKKR